MRTTAQNRYCWREGGGESGSLLSQGPLLAEEKLSKASDLRKSSSLPAEGFPGDRAGRQGPFQGALVVLGAGSPLASPWLTMEHSLWASNVCIFSMRGLALISDFPTLF